VRPRVRRYGDFGAGGLFRAQSTAAWEAIEGVTEPFGRLRWAEPASRGGDRMTRWLSSAVRGRAWPLPVESRRSRRAALECCREPALIMMCRS
jgi:hypothetical protein